MSHKITIVERTRFPKSKDIGTEKKLLSQLSYHRWVGNQQLNEYRKALKWGSKPQIKTAARYVTHSFSVRFDASITQNKRLPFDRRLSLVALEAVAHDLNLESACNEPVRVWAEPKKSGNDFRAICDFGPTHRTAQTVGRWMLECDTMLLPWQHDFLGTFAAQKKVASAILAGDTKCVHIDVQNFYGSFDPEALRGELPIPVRMVGNYLVARNLSLVPQGSTPPTHEALLSKARSGVSHGSSAAPIIGARTISMLNWHPTSGIVPSGYVDDLQLVGASLEQVTADAKAVCASLEALPTGHFVGKIKWIGDASEGFDFLGVNFRLDNGLKLAPANGRLEDFKLEVAKLCDKARKWVLVAVISKKETDKRAALQFIADAWQYALGWLAAFRICDDYEVFRLEALAQIWPLLSQINSKPNHLNPYLSKVGKGGYSD